MFLNPSNTLPLKLIAGALLALAVTALEAWLRVPIGPLLDGYLQDAASRVTGLLRRLPTRTFIPEALC
ncbi:hypothetical protein [Roseateles asaccharophilus]|uniref:Uncharacterized protein n=1 Tax=Roseateles asaccharophilus TaxID=582607 RepID=A0ABU2A4K8_9BURK|nr:hypothetical protein [Roseateles asaccharophilus]MDR7332126.1 hypothetical protein [Roseateles asaccharophilus]